MKILFRFAASLRAYKLQVTLLLLSLLGVTATSLVNPAVIRTVIDDGLLDRSAVQLAQAALVIVGVGFARALFGFVRRYLGEWLVNRIGYDLRAQLYDKIQRLPFGFHDEAQTGQLMSRCTEDVSALSRFAGEGAVDLLNICLLLAGVLVLLVRTSPALTLLSLLPLLLLTAVAMALAFKVEGLFLRVDQALGGLSSAVQEYATGVQVVRAFAREPEEAQRFAIANRELYDARVRIVRMWGLFLPTMNLLVIVANCVVLWYGGGMVLGQQLTLGQLVAFNAYLLLLTSPVQELGFAISSGGEAVAGGRRIYEVLDRAEIAVPPAPAKKLPAVHGLVEFDNVSLAYRGAHRALHNISFTAQPNQIIALVGPTGSGKSSFVNLLPRFYDPDTGSVRIDGHDTRSVDLKSLRQQIGVVLQTSLLFSASIGQNIAFGQPHATAEDIIAAATAARAHDFICSFPAGYDTWVGERGVTLSGGQRQRVAIARALLLNPRILILDDATSSVDTRTEHLIQQALDTLMQGRTTFVIAQRLSTVKRAHQILVLDGGRIAQRGTHAQLVQVPGMYQDLYNLQLRDQEELQRMLLSTRELAAVGSVEPVARAARPDLRNKPPQQPLRPSAVK